MRRAYNKPAVSPTCSPWGTDVSTLGWLHANGLDPADAPALWADLGDLLEVMVSDLAYLDAQGVWRMSR